MYFHPSPKDAEVAAHYLRDRADFEKTAKAWTEMHAGIPTDGVMQTLDEVGLNKGSIQRISDMGFERRIVIAALRQFEGDEGRAVDGILSGLLQ